ncbi:hypothetical protein SK854_27045 [Lentzea sp. BCCO 10_0061]|uniref:Uncharacterized protein n=1 Tax=Lentzea sokolovensis TaxID=3095429 RepID=A0ABU4V1W6_9PSEU|nr:hypothetical protein [Lentzea sp. BCCO 10_0061]MDX8145792.1 hypothetical protein [Lentzea sp. BCCO 10_0061]
MKKMASGGVLASLVVAGGLMLGMASPAHADYNSPLYPTLSKCNEARKTYVSSWTSPGPCFRIEYGNGSFAGYQFRVKTRY